MRQWGVCGFSTIIVIKMKKILFVLLFPTLFFSCIPMEKVTSDEYLDIRIHNRLSQPMSAYLSFDVDDNKGFFNKRDSVFPDSIAQMYGIPSFTSIDTANAFLTAHKVFDKNTVCDEDVFCVEVSRFPMLFQRLQLS